MIVTVRHLKFLKSNSSNHFNSASQKRKMAKSVGILFTAYLICWGPTFCILIAVNMAVLLNIELDLSNFVMMFYFVEVLSYANSLINPVIYFLSSRSFQKAARKMFRMKKEATSVSAAMVVNTVSKNISVVNLKEEFTKL